MVRDTNPNFTRVIGDQVAGYHKVVLPPPVSDVATRYIPDPRRNVVYIHHCGLIINGLVEQPTDDEPIAVGDDGGIEFAVAEMSTSIIGKGNVVIISLGG